MFDNTQIYEKMVKLPSILSTILVVPANWLIINDIKKPLKRGYGVRNIRNIHQWQ
jgi:hypothetical protein